MGNADNVTQLRVSRCPICGKPATLGERPFCSARCRDVDLSRWFKGGYRLPTEEPMGGEGAGESDFAPGEEQE